MTEFQLPADAVARLHMMPGTDTPYIVAVARTPVEPNLAAIITTPRHISALLTHGEGLNWPDTKGCTLAAAALEGGGGVVLGFAAPYDALACHRRSRQVRS